MGVEESLSKVELDAGWAFGLVDPVRFGAGLSEWCADDVRVSRPKKDAIRKPGRSLFQTERWKSIVACREAGEDFFLKVGEVYASKGYRREGKNKVEYESMRFLLQEPMKVNIGDLECWAHRSGREFDYFRMVYNDLRNRGFQVPPHCIDVTIEEGTREFLIERRDTMHGMQMRLAYGLVVPTGIFFHDNVADSGKDLIYR